MSAFAWSTQQLAEFLAAVSSADTEAAAAQATVERTAEELDAEVAAMVCDRELLAAVGYPDGATPVGELAGVTPGIEGELTVPGLGACSATAVRLEHPPGATLGCRAVRNRPGSTGSKPAAGDRARKFDHDADVASAR